MLTYNQQRLLIEMKKSKFIKRGDQNIYKSTRFFQNIEPLITCGLVKSKIDRYVLTLDGHIFTNNLMRIDNVSIDMGDEKDGDVQ